MSAALLTVEHRLDHRGPVFRQIPHLIPECTIQAISQQQPEGAAPRGFCRKQFFATEAAFRAVLLQNPPAVLFSAEREMRIPLLDSILNWQIPTSPKLNPALVTDPEPEP